MRRNKQSPAPVPLREFEPQRAAARLLFAERQVEIPVVREQEPIADPREEAPQ
jgi:hypothetical protein